ncbi:porin family protein [Dyadobacter subterraneus]|uniref:PorT family protein n=1 Tax=Dyadobacter subterraneus TaxID=2773304 RepID=A0ABR9WI13_9BACT|nr:porin family protein [Dyadobacter subterraneus]MBE9465158.1 PorT family protein [Dyadobacter subterraneus]
MKNRLILAIILSGLMANGVSAQVKKDSLQKTNSTKVMQNTVTNDSVKNQQTVRDIAEKVVESTFRNYPQQAGQPTIIINNIIVPPDYKQQQIPAPNEKTSSSFSESKENEEYQTWLREKRARQETPVADDNTTSHVSDLTNSKSEKKNITFQQRFAERPVRNSGAWVIPVVGVHASAFDSDVKKDNTSGRTGWNAGIDMRLRAKRFFVQPGLHYLNSSMAVTKKDSLTDTKFFSGPRIHSLKLPVMIGIYLTKANSGFFKLNVKAGAVGNYILAVDKNNQAKFTKDNLHEYAYGLNGGIGMEFGLITLDVTYEGGITKYFKDSNVKNNILRVTLGIKI